MGWASSIKETISMTPDGKYLTLGKIDPPAPVFFFARRDGTIFNCGASEAWATYKKMPTFGFTFIGRSSGQIFYTMMNEEKARQTELWHKATTTAKKNALETRLHKDTLATIDKAMTLELEEARKNPTPPVNDSLTVQGQSNNTVNALLSRMIN